MATTGINDTNSERRRTVAFRAMRNTQLIIGFGMIGGMAFAAVVLPHLLGLDPQAVEPLNRLKAPSLAHFLGTDNFGRDLAARILAGASTSLRLAASVTLLAAAIGVAVGILASFSRLLDHVLMRICDGLMAIPALLLALALTATFGPKFSNLLIALVIVFVPGIARLVRARALALRSETFVEAAVAMGASDLHIMGRHIFPNVLSVLAVQVTFLFAETIVIEAALSFLGAGVPPPAPSWGNILYDGKAAIAKAPYMVLFASTAMVMTVVGLTLIGDGLRDLVDPRSGSQPEASWSKRLLRLVLPCTKEGA
ncbi:ABC transporter permease [Mesorhizobium helmanticense]|uniref:Peptide ABC transporter permease n=1 Tax=Mesorhizobium helmanticense TaxID=1776423 RepID=A0A2T4IKS1_9HYPH|nr:ABC transporter permease [Mesorhizobium helmanticense]PTE06251.1 peptide ABC transporter permease [Mesorhizobium helmanticense]